MDGITIWVPTITVISPGNFSSSLVKGSATLITPLVYLKLSTDWQEDLQESWMRTKCPIFPDCPAVQVNRSTTKAYHPLCDSPLSKDSPSQGGRSWKYSFTCFRSIRLQETLSIFIFKTCNSHLNKVYKMKFLAPCWHYILYFATLSASLFLWRKTLTQFATKVTSA